MSRHVLSLLVEDKPGLLTRVAGLFARRGFNIESLAVGTSEVPGLSRITVVVDVEELPLEQVTKQLNKLINVINIVELERTTGLLKMLEQYGIRELAQSGLLAMGRGPKSITERIPRS